MTRYRPPSIEDEGIDTYLNRTASVHGGVDWLMFDGFVKRGMNNAGLMKAMNIRTYDTIKKYKDLRVKFIARQAEAEAAIDSLTDL